MLVQVEYQRTFNEMDCEIYSVGTELLAMEFPSEDEFKCRCNHSVGDKKFVGAWRP